MCRWGEQDEDSARQQSLSSSLAPHPIRGEVERATHGHAPPHPSPPTDPKSPKPKRAAAEEILIPCRLRAASHTVSPPDGCVRGARLHHRHAASSHAGATDDGRLPDCLDGRAACSSCGDDAAKSGAPTMHGVIWRSLAGGRPHLKSFYSALRAREIDRRSLNTTLGLLEDPPCWSRRARHDVYIRRAVRHDPDRLRTYDEDGLSEPEGGLHRIRDLRLIGMCVSPACSPTSTAPSPRAEQRPVGCSRLLAGRVMSRPWDAVP